MTRWLATALILVSFRSAQAQAPDFEKAIAPILARSCVGCHNPSEAKGKLDLTRREGLLKGGKDGPAIAPGSIRSVSTINGASVSAGSMAGPRMSRSWTIIEGK